MNAPAWTPARRIREVYEAALRDAANNPDLLAWLRANPPGRPAR